MIKGSTLHEWPLALTSARYLQAVYGDTPPALRECTLSHVHIDERGRSVTLGLETEVMPSPLPDEWRTKGLNTCEFFIVFRYAESVRIRGWDASVANAVAVSRSPEGCVSVSIGSEGSGMRFRAASASVTRVRGYLASRSA